MVETGRDAVRWVALGDLMGERGRCALGWSIPEDLPEGRCGFTVKYSGLIGPGPSVTCWRESWADDGRCIWHADVNAKNAGELAEARTDTWERLDGAVLREAKLEETGLLADCILRGADLTEANLREAGLTDADLIRADLTDAFLLGADLTDTNLREADLTDASLWGANLTNASLWGANLTDADFGGASLSQADLTNANLTNADLRRIRVSNDGVNLQGATAIGIGINYTRLDSLTIDEGTKFGGKSLWEGDSDNEASSAIPLRWQPVFLRCLSRSSTDPDDLKQAELQYRATQRILREHDFRQLPELAVREKHARRKRMLAERKPLRWLSLAGARWTTLYGESPWRVIYTSVVVIFVFGILFSLLGGIRPTTAETEPLAFDVLPSLSIPMPWWVETLGANLYFSAVTFSTLGYGDVEPASTAVQFLASIESITGAALMALLVAVLARRITR